ncbi:MAG: hypothetical protein H6723_08615 [Sandaracinus sp.]|nr:hypothetical protein [Sandaracinus sp.]
MSRADTLRIVREGRRFLVTCHRRPDADALGSAIGLAEILRSLGKEAHVWVPENLAPNLMFFAVGRVERELPDGEFDATFGWTPPHAHVAAARIPKGGAGPLVVVDHPLRTTTSATWSAAMRRVLDRRGRDAFGDRARCAPVPEAAAAPLYAALVADTGGFRYAMTTPETLRLGAELLERGADAWQTAYELRDGRRRDFVCSARSSRPSSSSKTGCVALLRMTATCSRTRALTTMVEGMVNYGRMLRSVEVAVLLWGSRRKGRPRHEAQL